MAAKKPVAAKPAINYGGTDLTPPPGYNAPTTGLSGPVLQATQQQNAANAANQQRYGQQLGVLSNAGNQANQFAQGGIGSIQGGTQAAQGYIQDAIQNSQMYGQNAQRELNLQYQQQQGATQQNAVGRGLGNTTVANSLQDQVTRRYNDANANLTEQIANRTSALNLNQANTAMGGANALANQQNIAGNTAMNGAGSIAGAIGARTDQAPNAAMFAQLQQQASAAAPTRRSQPYVMMGGAGGRTIGSGPGMFMG